jgi:polyphosphate kinase
LAFDPGGPFPHISNLSLNLAVLIRDRRDVEHFARVKVPDILPRLVPVTPVAKEGVTKKKKAAPKYLVWLE